MRTPPNIELKIKPLIIQGADHSGATTVGLGQLKHCGSRFHFRLGA